MDEVYMDIPAVQNIARILGAVSDVLNAVNTVLEALLMILRSTAFIGLVGGGAVMAFIERIKPHIKQMADKCDELDKDVTASVLAYENGDDLGATRFY